MTEQDGEMTAEPAFLSLRVTSHTNEMRDEASGINAEQRWFKQHLYNAKSATELSMQELDSSAIQDGTSDKTSKSSHIMIWRTVIIGNDGLS